MLLEYSPEGTSIVPATRQPALCKAPCTRAACSGPTIESVKIAQRPGSSDLERIFARSMPAPTKTLYGWVTGTATVSTGTSAPPLPPLPAGVHRPRPRDRRPPCRKGDVLRSAARTPRGSPPAGGGPDHESCDRERRYLPSRRPSSRRAGGLCCRYGLRHHRRRRPRSAFRGRELGVVPCAPGP